MSDLRVYAKQSSFNFASPDTWVALRALRDGAPIVYPWYQSLVLDGRVFAFNVGTVTTPVAGHATMDADQPEMAVRVPDGTAAIPLLLRGAIETGATTLGVHGIMFAVSNIDVGAGTSTVGTGVNLNMLNARAIASTLQHTYSGNGTDPLTAGNFVELARAQALIDSDAATSGFHVPPLVWSALGVDIAPIIGDAGSILGYWEGSTSAMAYGVAIWAEFTEALLAT